MAHDLRAKPTGLAVDPPARRVIASQIIDAAKHVELRADDLRTRVQFPPPPFVSPKGELIQRQLEEHGVFEIIKRLVKSTNIHP